MRDRMGGEEESEREREWASEKASQRGEEGERGREGEGGRGG